MTSRGERKVRELALKRNGDPWDTNDVKELIFAFADDQEDDHAESMERLRKVEEAVTEHVTWTETESLPRLAAVEAGLAVVEGRCTGHDDLHVEHLASDHLHEPRRKDDPPGATFDDKREEEEMHVSYRVGKWLVRGILGVVIVVLVTAAANFYLLRANSKQEIHVDQSDLHALILLLQAEHASPSPTPAP